MVTHRVAVKMLTRLLSSEGLTKAGGSVSKMAHPCGGWQISVAHWLRTVGFISLSQGLSRGVLESPYSTAASFSQNKWSEREQGRSHDTSYDCCWSQCGKRLHKNGNTRRERWLGPPYRLTTTCRHMPQGYCPHRMHPNPHRTVYHVWKSTEAVSMQVVVIHVASQAVPPCAFPHTDPSFPQLLEENGQLN